MKIKISEGTFYIVAMGWQSQDWEFKGRLQRFCMYSEALRLGAYAISNLDQSPSKNVWILKEYMYIEIWNSSLFQKSLAILS